MSRTIDGQGEQLKEYLLGVEVFDRRQSYDPRIDPIVRVDAARLRSKLREYYEKEGRDDAVLIDFNKGSYVPTFQRAAPRVSELAPIRLASRPFPDWKSAVLLLLAVVLGGFIYWTMALYRLNSALERQLESSRPAARLPEFEPIWGRFFSTRAENFVVFGSPVFFSTQQHNLFLRFAGVNDPTNLLNDPKFRLLQERFGPLSEPHFDYTEMGDAIALQRLTAFFGRAGVTLTALPAHQANWEAIKDGNLIFLGAPRMNPLLQHLPIQQDFEWGPDHNIYNRHPQPGEQPIYATPSHRDALTYAVIASFPGLKPNREVLLLTAHSTPGTLSAVEQVIQVENARAIVDRLHLTSSKGRKHFQILFRIAADKNVSIKTEYVTHHISPF